MTAAETALAFAKEILGWPGSREYASGWLDNGSGVASAVFAYRDLNAVMGAVVEWADRHRMTIVSLDYVMPVRHFEAAVYSPPMCPMFRKVTSSSPDPCEALMRACLEAAKME